MPLYLFVCPCGESTEAIRPRGTEAIACTCGQQAQRRAIYAPSIGGRARTPVSERRVSLREYTEASQQVAYEHAKAEEAAQQPLPPPPLWKAAKRQAAKLMAAGITDSQDFRPEYAPRG